jgi:hypothetical protein
MKTVTIEKNIPLLEDILGSRRELFGPDYERYRNHVYRVLHFCFAFHEQATHRQATDEEREKLIITGCFHDLGMWPGEVVDYLAPSIALAKQYLIEQGKQSWSPEIELMIDLHHKFGTVTDEASPLVEIFRKGDWVDASMGIRSFGLPKQLIKDVQSAFPNLGFHQNLIRLASKELFVYRRHPLPMMKK